MRETRLAIARLKQLIVGLEDAAVAVSGGVDSMTLAVIAGRVLGRRARMIHAVSPAVPPQATERVRRYAEAENWSLALLDAGEFEDQRYRANPVDRCFYCKHSLYTAIRGETAAVILSGTNMVDLEDFRPGLEAARQHEVRHPYVEAGIDKSGVRAIARALELDDLADLPAAPCLSSRIETGIRIEADSLAFINRVELRIQDATAASVVRCRVRADGIEIELDAASLLRLGSESRAALEREVAAMAGEWGIGEKRGSPSVRFAPYRQGSAFLRAESGI
ncbi:MAG: adenine nucleotide alpha hydrolase [Gemmatimonadota bacterium]